MSGSTTGRDASSTRLVTTILPDLVKSILCDATAWGSEEGWGDKQRGAQTDRRGSERPLKNSGISRSSTTWAYVSLPSSLCVTCNGRRRTRQGGEVLQGAVYAACVMGCGG